MTILSAMQSAAIRLVGRKPTTFFATQSQFEMEIADLVNEAAADIAEAHDWQALQEFHTITGDGESTSFPLPDDYGRMLLDSEMQDGHSWAWDYTHVPNANKFFRLTKDGPILTPGIWMMRAGEFQFYPAPSFGAEAVFPYVSKNYAIAENDTRKADFDTDNDSFVLDERLLTLELIWRWRAQKRLEYAEDMANAEKARMEKIGRDRGPRIIKVGVTRSAGDFSIAYPRALGS